LSASAEEFEKTSLKDFLPILMTLVKVVVCLIILGTGNLLLMGGAFYMYRQYTNQQKEKEMKEQGVY
jgi:cation-transporting ATPase 13A1